MCCVLLAPVDVKPVQNNIPQQVKHNTPDDASVDFNAVVFDIAEILEKALKHTGDVHKFKCLCCGLTINDQLFFSSEEQRAIKDCKSFHELFAEIHKSMRWDSHRLLNIIIRRVDLPEVAEKASHKLEQFEKKIKYQMKLKDVFDDCVAKDEHPPKGYAEMMVIIKKDYTQITVGDYKEIEDFLSTYLSELPPAKCARLNSVQFIWYIPTSAIPLLLLKAYQAREFLTLQPTIVYISIAGIMLWDKNESYSPQVRTCSVRSCYCVD